MLEFFRYSTRGRFRRVVTEALDLGPRGFIPRDVLLLHKLAGQLQLEWRTRDIPPWERSLGRDRRRESFRELTLHDTDAAIVRLFESIPEIDAIAIRVLEPNPPNRLILAGTVTRKEALATRQLASPGMRLKVMGIQYDGQLRPLD